MTTQEITQKYPPSMANLMQLVKDAEEDRSILTQEQLDIMLYVMACYSKLIHH